DGVLDWNMLFGRTAARVIDIGCGNGRSMLVSALARPECDFLGVDILELAARGSDAAAATAAFPTPVMQAGECVVCHKTLDPVAGLFQDYWRFDANFSIYGRRREGWFEDMFAAGFEGQALPPED
ncbi:MAG: hypothetical protein ACK5KS_17020, partial [Planctomyces sp.]